MNRHQR